MTQERTTERLNLSVTPSEKDKLHRIAIASLMTMSAVVRKLIQEAYDPEDDYFDDGDL